MSDSETPEDRVAQGSQTALFSGKKCFIASPIGSTGSDERRRSNLVKTYIIDEAVRPLGYRTVRADEIDKSGEITTQIVSDLIEADLLIADLTGQNANVFYELAIRHSFRKPYIQIVEEGTELPFDVRAFRTVFVNHRDLESASEARATIRKMVEDIESGGDVQSPVTHAVNRQQLETSQDPTKNELAQIGEVVERIDHRMRMLEKANRPPTHSAIEYTAADRELIDVFTNIVEKLTLKNEVLTWEDVTLLDNATKRAHSTRSLHALVNRLVETTPPF